MTALQQGLAAAAALSLCCASGPEGRRHLMPPPAREIRAGAPPPRSAGPASPVATASPPALARSPVVTQDGRGATATPVPTTGNPGLDRALASLSALVGQRQIVVEGEDQGPHCVALARAAFAAEGHPLDDGIRDVPALRDLAVREEAFSAGRRPAVGDLVFLADRPGGPAEHVGVVARTEADGTAFVLHRAPRGVLRFRMNLAYPARASDPSTGRHINDALLVGTRPAPAGSLVVGLSDLLRR